MGRYDSTKRAPRGALPLVRGMLPRQRNQFGGRTRDGP